MMKNTALRINGIVLFLLGLLDLNRGIAHTFRIHHAAVNLAQIDPHPDALVLMAAFGMSNFLTGSLFILIALKARHLAPVVLLLIPAAYALGGLGMHTSGVTLQSAFVGQHMMRVYLAVSLLTALFHFISTILDRRKSTPQRD
jgi:hypothetical protein